jgi:hypothetical protein
MQKHFMCLSRGGASVDVDWGFPADVVEGWGDGAAGVRGVLAAV